MARQVQVGTPQINTGICTVSIFTQANIELRVREAEKDKVADEGGVEVIDPATAKVGYIKLKPMTLGTTVRMVSKLGDIKDQANQCIFHRSCGNRFILPYTHSFGHRSFRSSIPRFRLLS